VSDNHQRNADAHEKNADPALSRHSLSLENTGPDRAPHVTQRGNRNDETYIFKRKYAQQCKEGSSHQSDAYPHPDPAQGVEQDADQGVRAEVHDLAYGFHCSGDAQLTRRPRTHHPRKKYEFFEQSVRLRCSRRRVTDNRNSKTKDQDSSPAKGTDEFV